MNIFSPSLKTHLKFAIFIVSVQIIYNPTKCDQTSRNKRGLKAQLGEQKQKEIKGNEDVISFNEETEWIHKKLQEYRKLKDKNGNSKSKKGTLAKTIKPKNSHDGSKPSGIRSFGRGISAAETTSEKGAGAGAGAGATAVAATTDDPDVEEVLRMKANQKVETYPKFKEWSNWGSLYPECNVEKNKFTSPIKINTSKVIPDKETPTLFIYSSVPIKDYKLSFNFKESKDFRMDALNIHLRAEKFQEATYLTGLGDVSYRFFNFALFLFAKDMQKLSEEEKKKLSLHRLDNKEFPMEIVLYFSTKHTLDDTTQLHVMVNISATDTDNPLFFPIIQAALEIGNRTKHYKVNEAIVMDQYERIADALLTLEEKRTKRKEEGMYEKMVALATCITQAASIEAMIEADAQSIKSLETGANTMDEYIGHRTTALEGIKSDLASLAEKILAMNDEAKAAIEADDILKAKTILADIKTMETDVAELETKMSITIDEIKNYKISKEVGMEKAEAKKKTAEENKKKVVTLFEEKGFKYTETETANMALHGMYTMVKDEDTDKREIFKQEKVLKELKESLKTEVLLELFQASWLLPPTGGYYMYNGSLPVPPCTRRGFTIVMENPILISKEQFQILSSIDKLDTAEPTDTFLPILAENSDSRTVLYNRKNLQFILDDAVHMKSKKRKKIKLSMKTSGAGDFRSAIKTFFCVVLMRVHYNYSYQTI